jgi:hypothetical protein
MTSVRAALGAGASTVLAIAERAYADIVGREQAGWMYADALCMLEHLERRGSPRRRGGRSRDASRFGTGVT